jgi:hypothetical protein
MAKFSPSSPQQTFSLGEMNLALGVQRLQALPQHEATEGEVEAA